MKKTDMKNTKMKIPSRNEVIKQIENQMASTYIPYTKDLNYNYVFHYLDFIIENKDIETRFTTDIHIDVEFKQQYKPSCTAVETLVLLVMKLLSEHIYCYTFDYAKIVTIYNIYCPDDDTDYSFCLSEGVNLSPSLDGQDIPNRIFYNTYKRWVKEQAEKYSKGYINSIFLKIYLPPGTLSLKKSYTLSLSEIIKQIYGVYISMDSRIDESDVRSFANKPAIPKFITDIQNSDLTKRSFIVADLETIITGLDKVDELYLDEESYSTKTNVSNSLDVLEDNLQDHPFDTTIIDPKKLKALQSPLDSKDSSLSKIERHVVYAAGFLVVRANKKLGNNERIETYFIEEKNQIKPSLINRSYDLIYEFIDRLVAVANKTKIRLVYFHNLSRFDGILILKALTHNRERFLFKTTMRNNSTYEIQFFDMKEKDETGKDETGKDETGKDETGKDETGKDETGKDETGKDETGKDETGKDKKRKPVLVLRDSYFLLPSSLKDLAANICPELGGKGSLDHAQMTEERLQPMKSEILLYMRQDVLLLGGILQNTQDLYMPLFDVDITNSLTVSSLALRIFRMKYYDPIKSPIYITTQNVDKFIRRGYYGGHSDVFKPSGVNLYVYDVNSLYPYIMKEYPMPCGEPVWHRKLTWEDISGQLGFVQAYVNCPASMDRPFLPYRNEDPNKDQTLIFPTGEWIGVYYIPELEHAKSLGYTIIPVKGYLYPNKAEIIPFKTFVTDLYNSRQDARNKGSKAMTYIYKQIMNSLYGRFGINPLSTITEICNEGRYRELIENATIPVVNFDRMNKDYYIVNFKVNTHASASFNDEWKPPKNSAVQISAAITAYARIHMYEHISRSDCVYTDTDSIFLENPLNEEFISQSEIGKFKLERTAEKGIFLAPKSYALENECGEHIIKQKGRAKDLVDFPWFEKTFQNLSSSFTAVSNNSFHIDRSKLIIIKKKFNLKVSLPETQKRIRVIKKKTWVSTKPVNIIDKGKDINLFESLSTVFESLSTVSEYREELEAIKKIKEAKIKETEEAKCDMAREEDSIKKPPS